jgi:hypothetical protein
MKSKITLKLDAALLTELRVMAAERGTSVRALLAAHLAQILNERETCKRGRERALVRLRDGLDLHWTRPNRRDELYDR